MEFKEFSRNVLFVIILLRIKIPNLYREINGIQVQYTGWNIVYTKYTEYKYSK